VPSNREIEHASIVLRGIEGVQHVEVERTSRSILASDTLVATITLESGRVIRFERVGYNAFGPNAVNIVVGEAGGLVPRIAGCGGVSSPNFHRDAPLGHHFGPTLIDVKDAVTRSREVLEEVEFWPACPQFWEVQDKRGANYRYCARRKTGADEPPPPAECKAR
jgi:hypothetical protein